MLGAKVQAESSGLAWERPRPARFASLLQQGGCEEHRQACECMHRQAEHISRDIMRAAPEEAR